MKTPPCITPAEQMAGFMNSDIQIGASQTSGGIVCVMANGPCLAFKPGEAREIAKSLNLMADLADRFRTGWNPTDDELRIEIERMRDAK